MTDFTPRPTTYNGIDMRSRLEAAWAEQFDTVGWPWVYEPRAFADRTGQYLPDFKLTLGRLTVFVEVKPLINETFDVGAAHRKVRSSVPDAAFILAMGGDGGAVMLLRFDPDGPEHCVTPLWCSNEHYVLGQVPAPCPVCSERDLRGFTTSVAPVASLHADRFAVLMDAPDPIAVRFASEVT